MDVVLVILLLLGLITAFLIICAMDGKGEKE